jgi:hypothetical protein
MANVPLDSHVRELARDTTRFARRTGPVTSEARRPDRACHEGAREAGESSGAEDRI